MGLVGPAEDPVDFTPAGEDEEFIYSPTDRPAEPVTAGAPVGPGPDFTKHTVETEAEFRTRVAGTLAQAPTREARALAERLQRGL